MSYLALYRKYRPSAFDQVMGQDHIVTTLRNQLIAERIGHAYLFCGTRGTGKTSIAKLFARAVNCEHPEGGNPCGKCKMCKDIEAGISMNVMEIDAASNNGVDNIRDIVNDVRYSPAEGRYKVYIIDEVHMLSTGAFNALLKTLEEPPAYVIFILATTEVHKIPITILSRCQRYDFKRISIDEITSCLARLMESEGIETEDKALRFIARTADGSMRDAQSLLDQCIAFYLGQKLTYEHVLEVLGTVDVEVFAELLRHITMGNVAACLKQIEAVVSQGREMTQFVSDFAWYLRNLLIAKMTDNPEEVLEFSSDRIEMLVHEAEVMKEETLIRYIRILSELSGKIKYAAQKRLEVEIALIKLCKPQMETDYTSLVERIRELEARLENGVVVSDATERPSAEVVKKVEEPVILERALPEEVKQVVENWGLITGKLPVRLKVILSSAVKLSVDKENRLVIVCTNETDLKQLRDQQDIIIHTIEEDIKKSLEVIFTFEDSNSGQTTEYPDIKKLIKMPIEYETV